MRLSRSSSAFIVSVVVLGAVTPWVVAQLQGPAWAPAIFGALVAMTPLALTLAVTRRRQPIEVRVPQFYVATHLRCAVCRSYRESDAIAFVNFVPVCNDGHPLVPPRPVAA